MIEIAENYAEKPSDVKIRKKLWLNIVKHVVTQTIKNGTNDIKDALDVMKKTEVLKIDDLLPYLPEGAKIESLKEDLSLCLDEYGNKINELKVYL